MLPDGNTLIKIDIGVTEKEIVDDLMNLYKNSTKITYAKRAAHKGGNLSSKSMLENPFARAPDNDKKSLTYKIRQTLDQYCLEECADKESIETILITGGMLNLKCQGKRFTKVLQKDIEKAVQSNYSLATVTYADDPEQGSILNGAKILCSLQDFNESMTVTKSEYEKDNQTIIKKFF